MNTTSEGGEAQLQRRLGVIDAVVIGLGAMIGAGIFVALAPAAAAAGSGLLAGLAVAAVVAYCNATSSARLAIRIPESGGTYCTEGNDWAGSGGISPGAASWWVRPRRGVRRWH